MRDHRQVRYAAAASLRELAQMLEDQIVYFECGCPTCLSRAAKNFIQIGEELRELVADLAPESVRDHTGPPDELPTGVRLSASGFRRTARSVRGLARRLERG